MHVVRQKITLAIIKKKKKKTTQHTQLHLHEMQEEGVQWQKVASRSCKSNCIAHIRTNSKISSTIFQMFECNQLEIYAAGVALKYTILQHCMKPVAE